MRGRWAIRALAFGALACALADEAHISWKLRTSTPQPTTRARAGLAHQRATVGSATRHYAWLFGGRDRTGAYKADLWRFDETAGLWEEQTSAAVGLVPDARTGCELVAASSTDLYLLMGVRGSTGAPTNEVLKLVVDGGAGGAAPVWSLVASAGSVPAARWGHTATVARGGASIILFGGRLSAGSLENDVWEFETATGAWTELFPSGVIPAVRAEHAAVALSATLILLHGGLGASGVLADLVLLDLAANSWTVVGAAGDAPAPRRGHTAALVGRLLVVMDGYGDDTALAPLADRWAADAYALLAGQAEWVRPDAADDEPAPVGRWQHRAIGFDSRMLVFGGWVAGNEGSATRETWLLRPSCSGTQTRIDTVGSLSDGFGRYAPLLDCSFVLSPAKPHTRLVLTLTESALADAFDRVYVYDSALADHAALLLSHSGASLPPPLVSSAGALRVRFVSGALGAGGGFRAAYRAVCAPGYAPDDAGACVACARGTYKPNAADAGCLPCGWRAFADGTGATQCAACPRGSSARSERAASAAECACDAGYVLHADGSCAVCPTGALCAGGNASAPRAGWCARRGAAGAPPVFEHCCVAAECPGGEKAGGCAETTRTMAAAAADAAASPCAIRVVDFQNLRGLRPSAEVWVVFSFALALWGAGALFGGFAAGWRCEQRACVRCRGPSSARFWQNPSARLLARSLARSFTRSRRRRRRRRRRAPSLSLPLRLLLRAAGGRAAWSSGVCSRSSQARARPRSAARSAPRSRPRPPGSQWLRGISSRTARAPVTTATVTTTTTPRRRCATGGSAAGRRPRGRCRRRPRRSPSSGRRPPRRRALPSSARRSCGRSRLSCSAARTAPRRGRPRRRRRRAAACASARRPRPPTRPAPPRRPAAAPRPRRARRRTSNRRSCCRRRRPTARPTSRLPSA
jgi:hypothetical protein